MRQYALDLDQAFATARGEIEARGLLLEADAVLPSLAGLLTGGPVRGSWWGHALGHEIFITATRLRDDPDVLVARLVNGKVTYLHRNLWPPTFAVATARETWQTDAAPPEALALLDAVERAGVLMPEPAADPAGHKRRREAIAHLEQRLLVVSREEHTESGRHAKRLESWRHWASRSALAPGHMPAAAGRRELEIAAARLAPGVAVRLPWVSPNS